MSGVQPALFLALTCAPRLTRKAAASRCPPKAASISGVVPSPAAALTTASTGSFFTLARACVHVDAIAVVKITARDERKEMEIALTARETYLCPAVATAPRAPEGTKPPPLLALVTSNLRAGAWPQYAARCTNVVPCPPTRGQRSGQSYKQ